MSYKVGDRVRIIDHRPDKVPVGKAGWNYLGGMDEYLGTIMTVDEVLAGGDYHMVEDNGDWYWEDYMIEGKVEFTAEDIKCGYLVKLRDGDICVRFPDYYLVLAGEDVDKVLNATNIREDLTNSYVTSCDIMEVRDPNHIRIKDIYSCWNRARVVWKREDRKKLTVEQIEQLLGYKIEIIDNEGV